MSGYVLRRLAQLIPLLVALSIFTFALGQLAPGDPARALLLLQGGAPPTEAEVAAFAEETGLDDPAVIQYGRWVRHALTGDLGTSFRTGRTVAGALRQALPVTAGLALLAILIVLAVGIPVGVVAALARGRWPDHASRLFALAGASLPSFWFAYLLILLFSVRLHLLPTAGISSVSSYVLPAATLALSGSSMMMRLTRGSVLEVLNEDFVQGARAAGIPQGRIVRHTLRIALNPIVTYAGLVVGAMLSGAVVTETVFAMPGIGKLAVDAIGSRDFPVIQGFVLLSGTMILLVNLAVDVLYGMLDPRARVVGRDAGTARAH